jgi:uncharacterized protein (TIGR00369 family)
MNQQQPATNCPATYGIVPRETAATLSGQEFLAAMIARGLPAPPFAETTGIRLTTVEHGRVVFEADPSARFYNPMGTVHGGWISMLLDSAMGCAVHSTLKPGHAFTTVDMSVSFVRPVFETTGRLLCEAEVLHAGGRIATAQGRVRDGNGKLVAHGTETCMILPVAGARG